MFTAPMVTVSVVLCSFNGAAFIKEQLASILAQTYPLHEIIVADDCSTDNTVAIIQSFARKYPHIRLYQNSSNIGYNKNFEQALQLATGEVLAIADQDDIWHPRKIEILLQRWSKERPVIYCNSALFHEGSPSQAQPNRLMRRFEGNDPRKLAVYNTVSGHAMLLKKDVLRLALPFHAHVYYDWWLTIVAASNGGVDYCPEVLVYQRWHGSNASDNQNRNAEERLDGEKKMVLQNLEQFRKAPGLDTRQKHFFDTLYFLWQNMMQGRGRFQLFFFLLKHRQLIYYSKRRKAAFISQLKRSYQYAFK